MVEEVVLFDRAQEDHIIKALTFAGKVKANKDNYDLYANILISQVGPIASSKTMDDTVSYFLQKEDKFVSMCYLFQNLQEEYQLYFYTLKEERHKGYATRLLTAISDELLKNGGIDELNIVIPNENQEAKHVASYAGFIESTVDLNHGYFKKERQKRY